MGAGLYLILLCMKKTFLSLLLMIFIINSLQSQSIRFNRMYHIYPTIAGVGNKFNQIIQKNNQHISFGYYAPIPPGLPNNYMCVMAAKTDSLVAGFFNKDQYIGQFEFPYVIKSKSFGIKTANVSPDSKQTPTQITIELSAVGSGTEDIKGTVPKPTLTAIEVLKGNFQQRTEMTNMDKKNVYYLSNIKFPFTASFKIGDEEVVIDFNNTGSYKVELVTNQ